MSKIIDKVFDASKKIVRSVFKGSPNLITTADLNRQIEAIKHQLDTLDEKTGVISDMSIDYSLASGTLNVKPTFSYVMFKGCSFSPQSAPMSINLTSGAPVAYLCLTANDQLVTFEDDATHEIAGAKFSDGTSLPAANQIVYTDEQLVLTHALSSLNNLVGVIAMFTLSETGNLIVNSNYIKEKESIVLRSKGTISDFDPNIIGRVGNGKSYDEALSIIENRFSNIAMDWTSLVKNEAGVEKPIGMSFKIQSGILYLDIPESNISVDMVSSGMLVLGEFPSSVKQAIITLVKQMQLNVSSSYRALEIGTIPYGEFGSFIAYSSTTKGSGEISITYYPTMVLCKVSMMLVYEKDIVSGNFEIANVYIGAHPYGAWVGAESNEDVEVRGENAFGLQLSSRGSKLYLPRMVGAIPLFGPSK